MQDEEVEELEEEYETDFVDELDYLEENESDDESEENHGERQKRGLGWLNKKKPQKNCVTQKKVTVSFCSIFKKTSANAKKIIIIWKKLTYFSFSVRQHSQEKLRHPQEGNLYSISQEKM